MLREYNGEVMKAGTDLSLLEFEKIWTILEKTAYRFVKKFWHYKFGSTIIIIIKNILNLGETAKISKFVTNKTEKLFILKVN